MSNPVLKITNLSKTYKQGSSELHVLNGLNLEIQKGKIIAIVGESGSGKSTFLQAAGLLDDFESGDIEICGQNIKKLSDKQKTKLRLKNIGYVYQYHHLLSDFTALENVMLPQLINNSNKKLAKFKAIELLNSLGLNDRLSHRPAELSGGQQQRVAIARALANSPSLLIADEPTGNLDDSSSKLVSELLLKTIKNNGLAAIIATHNINFAKMADEVLILKNGILQQL